MTRTVDIRSKATFRKIAETESISEPSRFSEKPVSVTKAVPKKNVSNDKNDYDISKAHSGKTKPVKGGKAGKPNDETMYIGHPSFENGRSEEPKREHVNIFVGDKADISSMLSCKQSDTESVSPPKGGKKPVRAQIAGLRFAEIPGDRFTLDWRKLYLDSRATYHTFFIKRFLRGIYESKTK